MTQVMSGTSKDKEVCDLKTQGNMTLEAVCRISVNSVQPGKETGLREGQS